MGASGEPSKGGDGDRLLRQRNGNSRAQGGMIEASSQFHELEADAMHVVQQMELDPQTEENEITKLLFIFSANGGRWNAIADSMKKMLMMESCALCSITHGVTGEKPEFRSWKRSIGVPVGYMHRAKVTAELSSIL